jgi:hypothetical protein
MTTERFTAEQLSIPPRARESGHDHPRPSRGEARERGRMRRAADDGTQQKVWLAFYVALGLLLFIGVAAGLGQRADSGEALPAPPTAPR